MKNLLKQPINWKKIGIGLLIAYAILWSYFYLAIQYSNNKFSAVSIATRDCKNISAVLSQQACLDALQRNVVNDFSIFKLVLGK